MKSRKLIADVLSDSGWNTTPTPFLAGRSAGVKHDEEAVLHGG